MPRKDHFSGLAEFLAVARRSSFRAAGAELGVSPSAVSQAIRTFELRLGTTLFQRTTRKVALTDAGAALLAQLQPAAAAIEESLEGARSSAARPAGNLRLSVPRIALGLVMWDLLAAFGQDFPDITVDLDVNDASVELAGGHFDAGVRMGGNIERDMVAVRLTDDFRCVVVGSPAYFRLHGRPASPQELGAHECIRYRFPTAGSVYRWEFSRGKRTYSVEPRGRFTINDHLTMLELAVRGSGLAYTVDLVARPALAAGQLDQVLAAHLPVTPGLFLYFPVRSQAQPKLRAFIDFAREWTRPPTKLAVSPPRATRKRAAGR